MVRRLDDDCDGPLAAAGFDVALRVGFFFRLAVVYSFLSRLSARLAATRRAGNSTAQRGNSPVRERLNMHFGLTNNLPIIFANIVTLFLAFVILVAKIKFN